MKQTKKKKKGKRQLLGAHKHCSTQQGVRGADLLGAGELGVGNDLLGTAAQDVLNIRSAIQFEMRWMCGSDAHVALMICLAALRCC